MPAVRERRLNTRLIDRADRRRARTLDASAPMARRASLAAVDIAREAQAAGDIALEVRAAGDIAVEPHAPGDITPQAHAPCDTSSDFAARDALVLAHADLVRSIAYRVGQRLPAHVDRGDLVGVGMIGLLEAATRYRPSTGVPFEAFARRRVHGAIMDSLRDLDWVPRSVRSLQRRANTAAATLRQQLGREPSRDEVADRVGANGAGAGTTRVLHTAMPAEPLQDDLSMLEQWPDSTESAEAALLRHEVATCVRREVARLPLREQQILDSYYRHDLRMAEIGQVIGVCESRVSQLRSAALARLRVMLASTLGLDAPDQMPPTEARWAAVLLEGGLSRPAAPRMAVPTTSSAGETPASRAA